MQAKSLGYFGEKVAAQYLGDKGYAILAKNFTVRGGEIDIIAQEKNTLVFVEVKTRSADIFGTGEESFHNLKRHRVHRAIRRYLALKKYQDIPDYRIDLIEIELEGSKKARLRHTKDIE
ncbi:YraN family protein [Candidatus Peregrinibacteria bacterium]|nr:YraN family protein [Candidatus Peregrinibacteria bacterium]